MHLDTVCAHAPWLASVEGVTAAVADQISLVGVVSQTLQLHSANHSEPPAAGDYTNRLCAAWAGKDWLKPVCAASNDVQGDLIDGFKGVEGS